MEDATSIILLVISGSAMMFILILAIILFVVIYNRRIREREAEHLMTLKSKEVEMLKAVINAEETEREKLAGNLHDEVGPLLSALKFRVTKYQRDLSKNDFDIELLEAEKDRIDDIMQNIRTVSHNLTPQFVLKFGIVEALRNYIGSMNESGYRFESSVKDPESISKQIQTNIYRITLELISNLIKYDKPGSLTLSLIKFERKILIDITHDGNGIDQDEFDRFADESKGLGLDSIKSRLLLINGGIKFSRNESENARIELTIPTE